eukprot:scaffold21544_cov41-Prasinocladus_malaysianus.AAC.1
MSLAMQVAKLEVATVIILILGLGAVIGILAGVHVRDLHQRKRMRAKIMTPTFGWQPLLFKDLEQSLGKTPEAPVHITRSVQYYPMPSEKRGQ